MLNDTKDGQTNHCHQCEELARENAQLREREMVLVAALQMIFTSADSHDGTCANGYSAAYIVEQTLNATTAQTADQVLRWHVEWMESLPIQGWLCEDGKRKCIAMNHQPEGIALRAIPKLTKENEG